MMITMIIVWSLVIGAALLVEFLTYSLVSAWFAAGGLAALISSTFIPDDLWYVELLIFFVVSFAFLLGLRPLLKKYMHTKTVPTNADVNVGKTFKLLKDATEGTSEIKILDVIWKVACPDNMKKGDSVEITGIEGNKYIAKGGNK
jgi:membrane protein implicated in regulation of membrane protease activity